MSRWTIENQDILEWAANYEGPKFHAMLCDPPYHLTTEPPTWKVSFGETRTEKDKGRRRAYNKVAKAGFMGKHWDGGNTAFDSSTWAALAEHLHPGAFVMAFASSRGWHRLACAIEDAGLVIQPSIFGWATGQSFPKATRIDTQIDKKAGKFEERKVTGQRLTGRAGTRSDRRNANLGFESGQMMIDETSPATSLARDWQGHRYGGQILKNALEPVIVAQKLWTKPRLDCIVETGAGALWVDGARIATNDYLGVVSSGIRSLHNRRYEYGTRPKSYYGNHKPKLIDNSTGKGRWPANFVLVHCPECEEIDGVRNCHENCPARRLGEQSGAARSSQHVNQSRSQGGVPGFCNGKGIAIPGQNTYSDTGTASRFFFQADWSYEIAERLATSDPVFYCAKASRRERDSGLDEMPPHKRPGLFDDDNYEWTDGKHKIAKPRRNHHPTVKPIKLCKWLATLLLPPDIYSPRRILVPFAGSGSEMIGALLAGWEEITGVEMEQEYCAIAEARLAHWLKTNRVSQKELQGI